LARFGTKNGTGTQLNHEEHKEDEVKNAGESGLQDVSLQDKSAAPSFLPASQLPGVPAVSRPEGDHAIRSTNCPAPNCAVSVSIITYQHADFIRQCLDSVLMQETTFPFEILLGEDDSSDGTREICQEYADKHPNLIRLFLHNREDNLVINGRATGRRNLVNNLQQARGKYIALLDGDDYWTDPTKLQRQYECLENDPEAAGCFHDWLIVNEGSGVKRRRIGARIIDSRVDTQSLIREKNIPTASMFFRNTIDWSDPPDLFFDTIKGGYLVALMVAQQGSWTFLDQTMSVYRVHSGGVWSGVDAPNDNHQENAAFFRHLAQWPDLQSLRPVIVSRYRLDLRRWAVAEAQEGRNLSSLRHFLMSLGQKDRTGRGYLNPVRYLWALLAPLRSSH